MIDDSTFRQNGLHRLAKQPHAPIAAASMFGILSYRMVILGQFGSKIIPWRQGNHNFHPRSSLELQAADGYQGMPLQRKPSPYRTI
jgi:hypothetical protein